jgi:hypothetical protein
MLYFMDQCIHSTDCCDEVVLGAVCWMLCVTHAYPYRGYCIHDLIPTSVIIVIGTSAGSDMLKA